MKYKYFILTLIFICTASFTPASAPSAPDYGNILMLGDSITQGQTSVGPDGVPYWSYRYNFWKKLVDENASFNFVGSMNTTLCGTATNPAFPVYKGQTFDPDHEGHWQWSTQEILSGKTAAPCGGAPAVAIPGLATWLQGYTPDIVLLHLGSNDAAQLGSNITAGVAKTRANLTEIIRLLRQDNPRVKIILAKIIPCSFCGDGIVPVNAINTMIPDLAAQLSTAESHIVVVDQYSDFFVYGWNNTGDTYDGIHPDESGQEKMAKKWIEGLHAIVGLGGGGDTIPPTVSLTASSSGSSITAGTSVNITANASDNISVAGVQFKLDGNNLGAEDTSAPYSATWDTTGVASGLHNITALARDAAGNTATSSAVTVSVTTTPVTNYSVILYTAGIGQGTVTGGGSYAAGATVALTATPSSGSTFAGWSPSPCAPSFSMPANSISCTATFLANTVTTGNIRTAVTTGSINANSNQLTVASAAGFQQGDWVIVEIGKEHGQGLRGTDGVGGAWPAHPSVPQYYIGQKVPKALQAKITNISGNILTLDKTAAVSVSNANVYLDVAPIIDAIIANPQTTSLILPLGNYAIGGAITIEQKSGFTFAGSSKSQTKLFSPKGVPSAQLQVFWSPGSLLKDFTLQGNWGDNGFGLNWQSSTRPGSLCSLDDFDFSLAWNSCPGAWARRGILITADSDNTVLKDIDVHDVSQNAIMVTGGADKIWAYRIRNFQKDPQREYIQWQFQWHGTNGGGCVDCEVHAPGTIAGFETFNATGVSFIRPKGVNATVSTNGSGGYLIEEADLRFTRGSADTKLDAFGSGFVSVNNNGDYTDGRLNLGGTIRNAKVVIEGPARTATGETPAGIHIANPRIRIEGGSVAGPDGRTQGINAFASNVYVTNFQVTGLPAGEENQGNIYVQGACAKGINNTVDPRTYSARLLQGSQWYNNTDWSNPAACLQPPEVPAPPPEDEKINPPTVSLTSPTSGTTITAGSLVTISATATDNTGVASVEFRDGSQAIGTDTSEPYSISWNTAGVPSGSHLLSAIAQDIEGNRGYSVPVSVTVPATPSPNGTRGTTVIDNDGVTWSIDANKNVLRNGVPFNGGWADELLWWKGVVYHHGVGTKEWYTWDGTTWISHGLTDPEFGGTSYKLGDINNDSQVSAFDAALAAQASVGLITLSSDQTKAADVNGSLYVTAFDAALIAQYSVGLITKFPVE